MIRILLSAPLLRLGVALLLIGVGPLVVLGLADPDANPVGLGILAMLTFWPSIVLIIVGLAQGISRAAAARR